LREDINLKDFISSFGEMLDAYIPNKLGDIVVESMISLDLLTFKKYERP